MSYPGLLLTNDGKDILAKGLAGKNIHFSRVAFGSGNFDYNTESVSTLTDLKVWEIDLPIVNKLIEGNGLVSIVAQLFNYNINHGFAAKEIGIFAIDPDNGVEKLYTYGNLGDEYTFIPARSGTIHGRLFFRFRITVSDAPNVTFNIDDSFVYVTKEDFDNHLNSDQPHKNSPLKKNDVDFATHFWTTDFDSHLHKISLFNSKKILLHDVHKIIAAEKKKFAELADFYHNYFELGLDANIFVMEDFKPATVCDLTDLKITSAAIGGNLLGVQSVSSVAVGKEFLLTDGVNSQFVTIEEINFDSPTYLKISPSLSFSPDLDNLHLCRTLTNAAEIKNVSFSGNLFTGFAANFTHNADLVLDNDSVLLEKSGTIQAGLFTLEVF